MSAPEAESARLRFPGVRPPRALLSPASERRMTARQRQLLEELESLVREEGLAGLTMAQIAARVNCSLRTLYGISPSKDELVLTVVDRWLHRIGRAAMDTLDATLSPLEALRSYLGAANEAVQLSTAAFARELAQIPGAKRLLDAHEGYVIAVTRSLLESAMSAGQIRPVETASLAHVLGGLGREFARPELRELSPESPRATAVAIAEIILRGLERG